MELKFATRLYELRKERNLLQKDVAMAIGVTNYAIYRWEKGRFEPNLSEIIKLAEFFGVSTDYLLGVNDF